MPSFGGTTCTFIRGEANNLKTRTRTWQIAGIAGYGAETLAAGDAPGSFVLVLHDTPTNVETWFGVIEANQGAIVAVVTDWTTYSNFLVTQVGLPTRTPKGDGGVRGEIAVSGVITA